MMFVSLADQIIYAHFFDRELRRSADILLSDSSAQNILYISLLMTQYPICVALSHVWESNGEFPLTMKAVLELDKIDLCEFVLNKGYLPINPFMVFNYFLSDRVDRNIVRQGNNRLIAVCEELWVFGPIADGVLFEIAHAKSLGKKVRYFSIGTRSHEIKEITNPDNLVFEPEVHARQIKRQDLISFINNDYIDDQLNLFDT